MIHAGLFSNLHNRDFRTVNVNRVQCCKSGIFDVAVHSSVGVRAYSMTRDENCNSFSSETGQQLYLGLFFIFSLSLRMLHTVCRVIGIMLRILYRWKNENARKPKENKSGCLLKIVNHLLLQMRWRITAVHWLNCLDFEAQLLVLI